MTNYIAALLRCTKPATDGDAAEIDWYLLDDAFTRYVVNDADLVADNEAAQALHRLLTGEPQPTQFYRTEHARVGMFPSEGKDGNRLNCVAIALDYDGDPLAVIRAFGIAVPDTVGPKFQKLFAGSLD